MSDTLLEIQATHKVGDMLFKDVLNCLFCLHIRPGKRKVESIFKIKEKTGYLFTIGLFRTLTPQQEKLVLGSFDLLDGTPGCRPPVTVNDACWFATADPVRSYPDQKNKGAHASTLDEHCQGLDASQSAFTLDLMDRYYGRPVRS